MLSESCPQLVPKEHRHQAAAHAWLPELSFGRPARPRADLPDLNSGMALSSRYDYRLARDILTDRHSLCKKQATSIRSIKSLVPLLDRVLVQRIKAEAKTASGIFLPESSVKELNEAKVLAVGPGALDKEGKRLPVGVQAGDRVLIPTVRRTPG